jgi:pyruvate-formate lyase-activating enzyme
VYDISRANLIDLARKFDCVTVLNQSYNEYSHPDAFYNTIRTANIIAEFMPVEFLNKSQADSISFFEDLVEQNPSFCIFPFIELLVNNGNTTVCCRSAEPITRISQLKDYATDSNYQAIRQKMLEGKLLPEHCSTCYRYEQLGMRSARQQETVEWANRLGIKSLDDLNQIKHPVYYEVRPSNVCNLQCRMCDPKSSHLIAKEYQQLQLVTDYQDQEYTNSDFVDIDHIKKLYVAGGEPTAMPEFYTFLDRCIQSQHTDFEFIVNTNATKISNKLRNQLKHFSNLQFIISIEGVDKVNHYIRWPSDWNTIVNNAHYLQDNNHVISFNITVSIYNVLRLRELLEFLDSEFPKVLIHAQLAESPGQRLSALNHPEAHAVLAQLTPIQSLKCYLNDPLLASFVDGLIKYYGNNPTHNQARLIEFFKFNDMLDHSRGVHLKDYIPELERIRP